MEPAQVSFWPRIFLWSSYSSRRISAVLPLISWTCNALDFDGLWLGTLTVAFHMRRLLLWHLRTHAINLRQLNWKEQRHAWQEQPHTHAHTFAVQTLQTHCLLESLPNNFLHFSTGPGLVWNQIGFVGRSRSPPQHFAHKCIHVTRGTLALEWKTSCIKNNNWTIEPNAAHAKENNKQ